MPNLLQRSASFLATKLQSATVAGRTVTYRRGQLESGAIQAWVSDHDYPITDEQGFVTKVIAFDWNFKTADLLIRGEAITPQSGDLITETLNGETVTYEVMPIPTGPEKDEPDTASVITRVHTKRISE
jgi:hypothetical protein